MLGVLGLATTGCFGRNRVRRRTRRRAEREQDDLEERIEELEEENRRLRERCP